MRKSTHTRPALEPLEEKALLSQVVPHHPVHLARITPSVNRPVTIKTNQLQGMVTGTYAIAPSTPAPGMNYDLNGSGQVGTLGVVKVTGFIHIGTNSKSAPTGTITLTDDKGSIQLAVTGKGGPRPLAPVGSGAMSLRYTIVSGTGAFRNYHGSGSVSMATLPITPVVTPPVTPPITTPPVGAGGGSATTPPVTPPDTTPPVTPPDTTPPVTPPVTTPPVTTPPVTTPPTTTPPTPLPPTPLPPTPLPPTPLPPTPLPPTTTPPTTTPPTPLPPVTPPGGAGGGSPGHNGITSEVGANAQSHLHKNAHAIKTMAVTGKPVGAPRFLHGEFILTFNGGTSNLSSIL